MAAEASGPGEGPSTSSGAAEPTSTQAAEQQTSTPPLPPQRQPQQLSRYESQKRRDWNTFLQYLRNHKPPLTLARCSGAHVIEFLKYLDQFGKTKVHASGCAYFGHPNPPAPCPCPLRQAWGSLDALIGRLRAAYEESGGRPESNPFGVRPVRIYLREVRESQAKARGIPYEKKKRKRVPASTASVVSTEPSSGGGEASSSSASAAAAAAAATASTSVSAAATGSSSTSGTAEGEGSSTKHGGASTSLV